jgi:predicted nuclease of predicted toxin-antitoxin system
MQILFDNGTPRSLARYLDNHTIVEARARGWDELGNGELLTAAEAAGFQVLLTTDKNFRYQQNLLSRKIAIVVLGHGRWTLIKPHVARIISAVDRAAPASYTEIEIPNV